MSEAEKKLADAVKTLVQAEKGRIATEAVAAVHDGRRNPLRFIQNTGETDQPPRVGRYR